MASSTDHSHPTTDLHKADFGAIYDQNDPRAYYSTLAEFDYQIPQRGADIFDQLLRAAGPPRSDRPTVLDVCCSFGIVTSLMTTDLSMDDLTAHYLAAQRESLSTDELVADDRALLRDHRRHDAVETIGIDIAEHAVQYAVEVGALDHGAAENLETDEPSPRLAELLSGVDLITTTGGIGYVTGATFERLLRHAPPTVTVASLCLRTYDYATVQDTLDAHGLVTERAEGTVRQRRFVSDDEQAWAIESVRDHGHDPVGREDDGYYHAELFVSRPADRADDTPLRDLITLP